MSKLIKLFFVLMSLSVFQTPLTEAQDDYLNVGRPALEEEIAAWDIDVRPDFMGLPAGTGSVEMGEEIWEEKCTVCHGSFGESNEVFTPIVGGITPEDVKAGRVDGLIGNKHPQRTTMMKLPTISTLWDYINRAMPWTAPKSLEADEVYALVAYILHLSQIVPYEFELSDENIGDIQKLLPHRNGMTVEHGLWDTNANPDVLVNACMENCNAQVRIHSSLPDIARSAHGDLRAQNRHFGATRGADTLSEALVHPVRDGRREVTNTQASVVAKVDASPEQVAKQHMCLSCHGVNEALVGPAFTEVADKYVGDGDALVNLFNKVRQGGSGVWGAVPMPAQSGPTDSELKGLITWILELEKN